MAIITDNDGNYDEKIKQKYRDYEDIPNIKICASNNNTLRTLEPQFFDANRDFMDTIKTVIDAESVDDEKLVDFMTKDKTGWALKVFNSEEKFSYPQYIQEAIKWIHDGE